MGDWEADTVAGVVGGAVLLTLVDRKSRYLRCVRLEKKTADGVNAAMIAMLADQVRHSITPDRGKEFARHAVELSPLAIVGPVGLFSSVGEAIAGPAIRAVASVALRAVVMVNLCVSFIVFLVLKVIQSQEHWLCGLLLARSALVT